MSRRLRIAQVAPPFERVPPLAYGGTERIVHGLVTELEQRGHDVTTFASGDSVVPGRHIETVPLALRPQGYTGDSLPYMQLTLQLLLARVDQFDLIHSHLEWITLLLARVSPVPVVSTFHGRLDLPWADDLFADPPGGLVAISENQASTHPDVPWAGIVYNGLRLVDAPFGRQRTDALCFVGRVAEEKGIVEAMEVAKASGRPLRIAAKIGPAGPEKEYNDAVFQPALAEAGKDIEFLGELSQADRDQLFAESYAALMPGSWPEPFGLVAIEALACGTPIIARRAGALPEIIRDGIDGFFGDDITAMAFKVDRIGDLDRQAIRESVIDRFSVERMTDGYEAIYERMLPTETDGRGPVGVMDQETAAGTRSGDRTGAIAGGSPRPPQLGPSPTGTRLRGRPALETGTPDGGRWTLWGPAASRGGDDIHGGDPMPQKAWSDKRERQYEHIKESYKERGVSTDEAEERAARTVNKERAEEGETKTSRRNR